MSELSLDFRINPLIAKGCDFRAWNSGCCRTMFETQYDLTRDVLRAFRKKLVIFSATLNLVENPCSYKFRTLHKMELSLGGLKFRESAIVSAQVLTCVAGSVSYERFYTAFLLTMG